MELMTLAQVTCWDGWWHWAPLVLDTNLLFLSAWSVRAFPVQFGSLSWSHSNPQEKNRSCWTCTTCRNLLRTAPLEDLTLFPLQPALQQPLSWCLAGARASGFGASSTDRTWGPDTPSSTWERLFHISWIIKARHQVLELPQGIAGSDKVVFRGGGSQL